MNNSILVEPLVQIETEHGKVLRGIKKSDSLYRGFGELYFSQLNPNSINAWKKHDEMISNLIVVSGIVKFVFFNEIKNLFTCETLSVENYKRITVPPGLWFGFQNLSKNISVIANMANIEHRPEEVERKEINEIDFDWSRKI